MTPKDKAVELVQKFTAHAIGSNGEQNWINAKNCALIAVEELIAHSYSRDIVEHLDHSYEYWQEVKTEITKL